MKNRVWVGLACLLELAIGGVSFGATRYVNATNASPASPFTSAGSAATNIQQAIDVSSSGDTIQVSPGVYRITSQISIPSQLTVTLRSTQSRGAIIDAQRLCRGMRIFGTNSVVEGFTIRNGVTNGGYGGGIYMIRPGTVRDCLVISNEAYGGAGICVYTSGALVENCTVQSNLSTYFGGGVILYANSTSTLNRCLISGNVASNRGGGIVFQGAGTASNCWIADNRTLISNAGGLEMQGGRLVNSVVVGNRAQMDGGGLYVSASGYVANCTVVSNRAEREGGGLYGDLSSFWNNIVFYNTAPTNANVLKYNCVFSNNCATTNFGGTNFTNAPTFVDFAGRNFHLTPTSSCLERGATNPAVRVDYDGVTRPQQATLAGSPSYDVGAFEYRMFWDAGYEDIGSGWRRLTWFGDYTPMGGAGWNWHNKHGFLFAATSSYEYDIWFYTQDMGWLWTSCTKYPYLYRSSDGAWLWYNGSTNPRWFRNMTANTWESRP